MCKIYDVARTQVRSSAGVAGWRLIKASLHRFIFLYLFDLLIDVLAIDVRDEAPWCMLFADDVVLCNMKHDEVERKAEMWRKELEVRGL